MHVHVHVVCMCMSCAYVSCVWVLQSAQSHTDDRDPRPVRYLRMRKYTRHNAQTLQFTPLHPELRRFVCKWKCPALTLVCTVGAASRCCSQPTLRHIIRLGRKLLFSLTAQPGVCATLDATDHNTSTWSGRCGQSICHRKEVLRAT